MIKVTEDGFVWLTMEASKAEQVYNCMDIDLFVLHEDGSESKIHTFDDYKHAHAMNALFAIEVGQLTKENLYPFFKSLTKKLK